MAYFKYGAVRYPTLSSSGRRSASSISLQSLGDAVSRWDQEDPELYCCQANWLKNQGTELKI